MGNVLSSACCSLITSLQIENICTFHFSFLINLAYNELNANNEREHVYVVICFTYNVACETIDNWIKNH